MDPHPPVQIWRIRNQAKKSHSFFSQSIFPVNSISHYIHHFFIPPYSLIFIPPHSLIFIPPHSLIFSTPSLPHFHPCLSVSLCPPRSVSLCLSVSLSLSDSLIFIPPHSLISQLLHSLIFLFTERGLFDWKIILELL